MAKIILRGNQEEQLLWALDIAVNSYWSGDAEQDRADAEFRKPLENLRASIEKQLGVKPGFGLGSRN